MVGTFHVGICPHNRLLYGPETQGSYLGELVPMGVKNGTPHRTILNACLSTWNAPIVFLIDRKVLKFIVRGTISLRPLVFEFREERRRHVFKTDIVMLFYLQTNGISLGFFNLAVN